MWTTPDSQLLVGVRVCFGTRTRDAGGVVHLQTSMVTAGLVETGFSFKSNSQNRQSETTQIRFGRSEDATPSERLGVPQLWC